MNFRQQQSPCTQAKSFTRFSPPRMNIDYLVPTGFLPFRVLFSLRRFMYEFQHGATIPEHHGNYRPTRSRQRPQSTSTRPRRRRPPRQLQRYNPRQFLRGKRHSRPKPLEKSRRCDDLSVSSSFVTVPGCVFCFLSLSLSLCVYLTLWRISCVTAPHIWV